MFAARMHAVGAPASVDEVDDPVIEGPTDVIVRVAATGLCRTDLHVIDGGWRALGQPLPTILGHETAGWVHAVGGAVEGLDPGDPVIVHPYVTCGVCPSCRAGDDQFCTRFRFHGLGLDGGFAGFLRTRRSLTRPARERVPARRGRRSRGRRPGRLSRHQGGVRDSDRARQRSLIGVGGLGHVAIQLVHALTPATVVAIDRSESALALARQVGADHAVGADGRTADAVRDLTDGRGADVVFDFVGDAGTPIDGVMMLARRGRYVAIGYGGRIEIDTRDLVEGEIRTTTGSLIGTNRELAELVALAERTSIAVSRAALPARGVRRRGRGPSSRSDPRSSAHRTLTRGHRVR